MWCQIANCQTIDEAIIDDVYIKMKDPSDEKVREDLMKSLASVIDTSSIDLIDTYKTVQET